MGNSTATEILQHKLETSKKTGVLNLTKSGLKPSNKIWRSLGTTNINGENIGIKIRCLDISENPLKSIPEEVKSLSNLKTFAATHCHLLTMKGGSIKFDDASFVHLQQVDLSHNEIEVDNDVTFPISLLKLNLSFNHFSGVPSFVSHLINLTEINLSHNRIESMVGIGTLTALTILLLDDNSIVEVPKEASNLKLLKKVSLKNNRIGKRSITLIPEEQSIPECFFTETPVDAIDLTGNPITNTEINRFHGVEIFYERNRLLKEKNLTGGAYLDFSVFGLT